MKICLLTDSLGSGGAEKISANMSISLSNLGFDVHIICMQDIIEYNYKGTLFNFGEIKAENNKLNSFLILRNYFLTQSFTFIIDHRIRCSFYKEFLFSKFLFRQINVIYVIHHVNLYWYFPQITYPRLTKLSLAKNKKFISVSLGIQLEITRQLGWKSDVIYNYTIIDDNLNNIHLDYEYIIAVGRLEKIKQFDVLIHCYKNSKLPKNKIKLLVLGEGRERGNLLELINRLNLEQDVKLLGFVKNSESYIKKAKALVLSSKREGFPMVLIEAIALKTPVISFDCPTGPKEIVKNGINGVLVENQNKEALTTAFNNFILDQKSYQKVKEEILEWKNPFLESIAIQKWLKLLNEF